MTSDNDDTQGKGKNDGGDIELKNIRKAIQNVIIGSAVSNDDKGEKEPKLNLMGRAKKIMREQGDNFSRRTMHGRDPNVFKILTHIMWRWNREIGSEFILSAAIYNGYLQVQSNMMDVVNTITNLSHDLVVSNIEEALPMEDRIVIGSQDNRYFHIWSNDKIMSNYASLASVLSLSSYIPVYFAYGMVNEEDVSEIQKEQSLRVMREFERKILFKIGRLRGSFDVIKMLQ